MLAKAKNVEAMVVEGLAALDEFEKDGDRSHFKAWLNKFGAGSRVQEQDRNGPALSGAVEWIFR